MYKNKCKAGVVPFFIIWENAKVYASTSNMASASVLDVFPYR